MSNVELGYDSHMSESFNTIWERTPDSFREEDFRPTGKISSHDMRWDVQPSSITFELMQTFKDMQFKGKNRPQSPPLQVRSVIWVS